MSQFVKRVSCPIHGALSNVFVAVLLQFCLIRVFCLEIYSWINACMWIGSFTIRCFGLFMKYFPYSDGLEQCMWKRVCIMGVKLRLNHTDIQCALTVASLWQFAAALWHSQSQICCDVCKFHQMFQGVLHEPLQSNFLRGNEASQIIMYRLLLIRHATSLQVGLDRFLYVFCEISRLISSDTLISWEGRIVDSTPNILFLFGLYACCFVIDRCNNLRDCLFCIPLHCFCSNSCFCFFDGGCCCEHLSFGLKSNKLVVQPFRFCRCTSTSMDHVQITCGISSWRAFICS